MVVRSVKASTGKPPVRQRFVTLVNNEQAADDDFVVARLEDAPITGDAQLDECVRTNWGGLSGQRSGEAL